jgi:hypothetical protein
MASKVTSAKYISPVLLLLSILAAVAIGAGGMFLYTKYNTRKPAGELASIQARLADAMILPDEQPTFATVSDVTKLRSQPFFAHAVNGDKLLVYGEAKKAILFRPSTNKIIEIGPVNAVEKTGSQSAAKEDQSNQQIRVAIYNGTGGSGLAKAAQQQLEQSQKNIQVVKRGDAATIDYTITTVIALNELSALQATQIANTLQASVGTLPVNEEKPDADILIILGSDYTPQGK